MKLLLSLVAVVALTAPLHAKERIVSAAGSLTETLFALGAQDEIVAVDVSSVYPVEVNALPKIGYARQLSAEGILGMNPSVIFVTEDAGPPEVLKQLADAKVKVVTLDNKHTPEAAAARILTIGETIGRKAEAEKIVAKLNEEVAAAKAVVAAVTSKPKVMFIYARGGGVMNVSGSGTSADAIIEMAGGVNAVKEYENYKPLTAEGAVTAAPDVILLTTRGMDASGGMEGLLKQPGLALTPAGQNGRIVVMDDLYLLGFGPRLGQATKELCEKLHPESQPAGQ